MNKVMEQEIKQVGIGGLLLGLKCWSMYALTPWEEGRAVPGV